MNEMNLTIASIEKITASIIAGMIQEAAYKGQVVTAQEISDAVVNDPEGETATYFIRNSRKLIELAGKMQEDIEILEAFTV
jgi:hypothetical protein